MHPKDHQILRIALPSIISNITVPLLGLVDVTIVGHLGSPAYIGAIAVGGMLFNVMYWLFAFLRMGTGGMTSQAWGGRDLAEVMRLLVRALSIGLVVALCLVALQVPIRYVAFLFIHPTPEVQALAATYFHICIWGAPAMLTLYGLTGWFIGMQNSRLPMWIAIVQNLVNIVVSLVLVYLFGMKVEGVAWGTVVAQYAGLLMGLILWAKYYGRLARRYRVVRLRRRRVEMQGIFTREAMGRFFSVNRDIFLRTLCLVAVTLFFTSAGAAQGDIILAVNTLLMQLFTLYSYFMDGVAFAGEAMSGRYLGARNREAFQQTVHRLFLWGTAMAILFTLAYALGGNAFLGLLTDEPQVIRNAADYLPWAMLIPVAGTAAFIWDGIFIGATATRAMLLSMAIAAACFFLLYFGLRPTLGNHALWLAFISYLALRGAIQTMWSRRLYAE